MDEVESEAGDEEEETHVEIAKKKSQMTNASKASLINIHRAELLDLLQNRGTCEVLHFVLHIFLY